MYDYSHRVGFSQCGANRALSITSMMDVLQDASIFHSEDLGVGYSRLDRDNLIWVLNYWEINIIKMPDLCQRITVGTFPYDFKGCFGYRNFYIKDESGEFMVKANTLWTLLDGEKMVPARTPQDIKDAYELEDKLDMTYSSRKVTIPEGGEVLPQEAVSVSNQHLDGNGHVNNGQYVKLVIAALENTYEDKETCGEFLSNIRSIRVDYRKQALLGDVIYPVVVKAEDAIYVSLNDENGTPYSVAQLM